MAAKAAISRRSSPASGCGPAATPNRSLTTACWPPSRPPTGCRAPATRPRRRRSPASGRHDRPRELARSLCRTSRRFPDCDMGATILEGYLPGGRWPISGPRGQYGAMCMIGTFSQYGVIHQTSAVKVDDDLPLDKAVLVGCGVPTGWGSAVYTADVAPGDTVAVYGVGGIGINAVQGARYAGAKYVIAVDPLPNKREKALEVGATHAFGTAADAQQAITELTRGQ